MKKALKITNDTYLNMESIVIYKIEIDRVIIRTTLDGESNGILISAENDVLGASFAREFVVPMQEIKRIQKEICTYMGIE